MLQHIPKILCLLTFFSTDSVLSTIAEIQKSYNDIQRAKPEQEDIPEEFRDEEPADSIQQFPTKAVFLLGNKSMSTLSNS
jgi:hypothetical protein